MPWNIIHINDISQKLSALKKLEAFDLDREKVHPYQDIQWLLDGKQFDANLFLCVYSDEEGNVGYCILRKQPRPVRLLFGEFTVYQRFITRFELWSTPIIKLTSGTDEVLILNEFLTSIDELMADNEALSIEGLPVAAPFYRCVTSQGNQRLHLQLGPSFMHQSIEFPETFDAYLKQMSKRSRTSVQYSQRKLRKDFRVELFECNSSAKIEEFLDESIAISKKTYQWNLLGLGLRDRPGLKASLEKWDRNAELLSFILRCDNKPVAFMLGYIYRSSYHYIDVGYDPEWASYSPGSVLQFSVIERLFGMDKSVTTFDFSTGYGEHKGRFGNAERSEVNVLVLPVSTTNRAFIILYNAVNLTSSAIVKSLDRLGVKNKLKKIIRRLS